MIDHQRIRRQVIEQVELHPETLNMSWWAESVELSSDEGEDRDGHTIIREYGCGTSACIAGWAVHFATDEEFTETIETGYRSIGGAAQYLLGFTSEEADSIFEEQSGMVALGALKSIVERDTA